MTVVALDQLPAMDVAGRVARVRDRFERGRRRRPARHPPPQRALPHRLHRQLGAMLLVTDDALVFVADGRYRDQAAEQLAAAGVDARIEIGATVAGQREALAAALAVRGAASASRPTA